MNKESIQEVIAEQPTTSLQGRTASLPGKTKNVAKTSRPIHKRRAKNQKKVKISTAATSQMSSQEHSFPSQQTVPSTLKHSKELKTLNSFDLQNLIPSDSQTKECFPAELKHVCGYIGDIGQHLLALQAKFPRVPLNYSVYFGPAQRLRCVSLICNYGTRIGLRTQTKFLAIEILHRICTVPQFERYHSALKAAASLYVAANVSARVFAYMDPLQPVCPQNIIKLQSKILVHLDFNLSLALPIHFAQLLSLRYQLDTHSRQYLLQLCLQGLFSQQLWLGGGSLLAMACMSMVGERLGKWQNGMLMHDLKWRVQIMKEMVKNV